MYKVTCLYQGTTYTIHDPESDDLRIYDDEIETEDNEPGSFKFTVSYNHPYLDKIAGLESDIRVYDGNEEIFRGRPIDDGEDLYRMRTFTCEGELAFLYDSIQPRRELHDISPLQFLTLLLEEHNAQVANKGPIDKTFRVGAVTVTDPNDSLYRYTNRETTLDCIGDKLLNRLGGHLCVRISGGYRYLDLLKEVTTVGDQPIQLGENLLDYAKDTDYTQVATACIPLGERMDVTEIAALDAYVTVETVNNGSDCLVLAQAVQNYGFICKVVNFEDISLPANLKTAGENWLTDGQYSDMTLTLTAVDLHGLGHNVQPIRKNTKIRVLSDPHGMNRWFEVSKRTYHLTQPEADTVVFGTSERKKSFTASSKKQVTEALQHTDQLRRDIDTVITQERQNVSNILNQATHGYVVLDPNSGPERLLIMDTNSASSATKIWKFDLNGLGYARSTTPGTPLDQLTWGIAMTMDGRINANFITTGTLLASIIKAGILSDVNGVNFWNMETGEFRLAATTKVGTNANNKTIADYVSDAADTAVDAQTQADIFNKLTNNGQTQGIYLQNGKVYINGTYLQIGKISSQNGLVYFDLANNELHCDMLVSTESNNEIVSKIGTIYQGGNGTSSGGGYRVDGMAIYRTSSPQYSIVFVPSSESSTMDMIRSGVNGLTVHSMTNTGTSGRAGLAITPSGTVMLCKGSLGSFIESNIDNKTITDGAIYIHGNDISLRGDVGCNRTITTVGLTATGTKSRLVDTDNYDRRLLFCYEMSSPMFGDIGEGEINSDGECVVEIDDIFAETIKTDFEYQVFLQKEGPGDVWVDEKTPLFFVVKGTPGLKFAWELKSKQNGYETERLERLSDYAEEERIETPESIYENELEQYIEEMEAILYETA